MTSSSDNSPKKWHPDLWPLDVQRLVKELNLVAEGKRLGEAGVPSSDAVVLTAPEAAVVQRVEKARFDYVDWAAGRLGIIQDDLAKSDITQEVNRARQADQEFERKASTLLFENESLLRNYGETARKRKVELENFRQRHRLTHEAHYLTGWVLNRAWMFLAAVIGLETFVNAQFFAEGVDGGLVEGGTYAFVLALINVAVAFIFGRFFVKYVHHVDLVPKLAGMVAVLLAMAAVVTIGFSIAHYREAVTGDVPNASAAALHAMKTVPFQLGEGMSYLLCFVSILFALGALADGYVMDDRYPGYGAVSRREREAVEFFEGELSTLHTSLEELKETELKLLDETVRQSQASLARFSSSIESKAATELRLQTALGNVDNALTAALSSFRTENEAHRKALPRPRYFDTVPAVKSVPLPDFDTAPDTEWFVAQRTLVDQLVAEVQDIRGRIQAAFGRQFDSLQPLTTHFSGRDTSNG